MGHFLVSNFQFSIYLGVRLNIANPHAPNGGAQIFEPLFSAEEAAEHLRIHVKTLQKLAREQRVPCVRMGKYWRFRLSSLDHWVTTQENQSSQPLRVE
jgi:excisionase family DNA binding protein